MRVASLAAAGAVLLMFCSANTASAQETEFAAVRAPHPLALDPALHDPAWQLGRVEPDRFWNLTKRSAAAFVTRAYLLYDDANLYVAFHAEQAGTPIVGGQTTNNVGFGFDDFVGVALDSGGTGSHVYFFETTPRATRYQQASESVRYVSEWRSAAIADGDGWNAVMVIPFAVMRTPPGPRTMWRINFIRSVAAQGEHYTWAYDGLMTDGAVGQSWPSFGDSRFWPVATIERKANEAAARPKAVADVYALASAGSGRDLFEQNNGTFEPQRVRSAGIDVTVPLTPTINGVATVDPDFSNVEVDQQTIAPQEFPRQLQEYRPFFAQGAKFLNADYAGFSSTTSPNDEIFYSPRIGPFDEGAKVEGSFGLQSFGLMNFRGFDQTTGNEFDDVAYGYRHSLPDQSFLYWAEGVLAHHSIAGDDATTDFGAWGRDLKTGLQWGDDATIERGSWVPDTAGIARNVQTTVGVVKPNWVTFVGYNDTSPNYNPIDGFSFDSDIRGFQGFAQTLGAAPWLKNYNVQFLFDRWLDRSGAVHEVDTLATLTAAFKNGFSIDGLGPSVGVLRSYDIPEGDDCDGPIIGTSSFTGFPCYRNGHDQRYDLFQSSFGYKDGTPTPYDASFSFGPFGSDYDRIFSLTTSRQLGRYSLGLEYDGTWERALGTGVLDSQWLRRVSLGESLGADANVTVSIRAINGLGGFAPRAGSDIAVGYHRRFTDGDEMFVDYGTPAAYSTLHRLIIKYVVHAGGRAG